MRYYTIDPMDRRFNNWVFFEESKDNCLVLRDSYKYLECRQCKKFDEKAALHLPIETGVKLEGRSDMQQTDDGIYYCNERVRNIIQQNGISGLNHIELPGTSDYSLLVPTIEVEVDDSAPGFRLMPPLCTGCGRHKFVSGFARLSSLQLPHETLAVFTPQMSQDNGRTRVSTLLISHEVMRIFNTERVSGVTYSELAQVW